jgi:hypothetical protein
MADRDPVDHESDDSGRTKAGELASGVRLGTVKTKVCSVWPEEDEDGRN